MYRKKLGSEPNNAASDTIDTNTISDHSVTLKPGEQRHILLGEFTLSNPPKGFSIELSPDPFPDASVETQITTLSHMKRCKYVLIIANYGTYAVTARVRQL